MVLRNLELYGVPIVGQLCVLGNESSLGDPILGGPITAVACNYGNIRYRDRTPENAVWHDYSTGKMTGVGEGVWFTFPSPAIGMRAWGCFLKQSAGGAYIPLLRQKRYREFATTYYGDKPGLDQYVADLEEKDARYTARLRDGGYA
jgi:hypothetical protein